MLVWGCRASGLKFLLPSWSLGSPERLFSLFWVWFKFLEEEYANIIWPPLDLNCPVYMFVAAILWDSLQSLSFIYKISWKDDWWSSYQGMNIIVWKLHFSENNISFWSDLSQAEFFKLKKKKILLSIKICKTISFLNCFEFLFAGLRMVELWSVVFSGMFYLSFSFLFRGQGISMWPPLMLYICPLSETVVGKTIMYFFSALLRILCRLHNKTCWKILAY